MKISNSSISMSSQSTRVEIYSKEESLKAWIGSERPNFEGNTGTNGHPTLPVTDTLDLSDEAKSLLGQKKGAVNEVNETDLASFDISDIDKRKIRLLQEFLQRLTGKKYKFVLPEKMKIKEIDAEVFQKTGNAKQQPVQRQGWGIEYESHESYYEQQKMSFSAQGIVKTSDGREINLSVQLTMSHEFASQQNISIRAGDAVKVDPLVINFEGTAPTLTEKKYSFDLDTDGQQDQISFVNPGSGFLALDLNSDNIINDGTELFGPKTGNGFSELNQYDSDSNNWIDENDPIYEKLRIWTKDENGNDKLFALGEKGIGAIYLGNADTDFSIKNTANALQGEIKKTGVFLKENGTPGTAQHIDLVI